MVKKAAPVSSFRRGTSMFGVEPPRGMGSMTWLFAVRASLDGRTFVWVMLPWRGLKAAAAADGRAARKRRWRRLMVV